MLKAKITLIRKVVYLTYNEVILRDLNLFDVSSKDSIFKMKDARMTTNKQNTCTLMPQSTTFLSRVCVCLCVYSDEDMLGGYLETVP